jgi:hypothetical protein
MQTQELRFGRTRAAPFGAAILLLALTACGGGDADLDVDVDDVDGSTDMFVTSEELDAFRAPADSVLTPDQVTAYLRTSLLQYDLVRDESKRIRELVGRVQQREEKGGALRQFQNMVDAGRTMGEAGDIIGGSFVRASRTLGYNPAEMEWVQERMAEVSSHLMLKPLQQQSLDAAADLRKQAEAMRQASSGGSAAIPEMAEQVKYLLEAADQIEAEHTEQASRSALRNESVLRDSRPAVTAEMWTAIGFAGGASGLVAISGFGDPDDAELDRKLDEFRRIYEAALENRAVEAGTPL